MWHLAEGGFVKQQCIISLEGILFEGPSTLPVLASSTLLKQMRTQVKKLQHKHLLNQKCFMIPGAAVVPAAPQAQFRGQVVPSLAHCGRIHQQGCKSCLGNKMQTKWDC